MDKSVIESIFYGFSKVSKFMEVIKKNNNAEIRAYSHAHRINSNSKEYEKSNTVEEKQLES